MKAILKIRVLKLVGFLLFAPSLVTYSQYFHGYLQSPQGNADCNPCVQNVIHSVNTLRDRGETMGFNWGADYPPIEGSGTDSHWQGIQRMPILPNDGLSLPYIAVSSSHGGQSNPYARFAIVKMGSRDQDGLRFRSNRLAYGQLTKDVPPDSRDQIVVPKTIRTDYDHAGGIQTIGKYLLVGTETDKLPDRGVSILSLFDISKPQDDAVWEKSVSKDDVNSVGIVRLSDGGYLMMRTFFDANSIEFYRKFTLNLANNDWAGPFYLWKKDERRSELHNPDGSIDNNWSNYQSINIVTECESGRLFLIASHNDGSDFVDAYRLDVLTSMNKVFITKVAKRHMFLDENSGERQGDLQAAGGVYISPDNKLYFYATEHGRNGPGNSVKMIEFGPEEPRPQVSKIEEAWVELYADKNFEGRTIILDYVDRDLRDYNNFDNIELFGDKVSSAIYAIPIGYKMRLYEHDNQGGGFFDLNGTGRPQKIADLHDALLGNGEKVGDNISSALWSGGQSAEVWVDFNYRGNLQDGSFDFPYNSLIGGLAGVLSGGVMKMKSGSSSETLAITKPVTLQAPNGMVVIGKQ